MKNKFLYWIFAAVAIVACDSDDLQDSIDSLGAPEEVDLTFNITQDNTGLVTITPKAKGASKFEILSYGDNTNDSVELALGESIQRTYAEGNYDLQVRAFALNGKITDVTKNLVVSFRAPENLEITTQKDPNSALGILVSATADFATMFEVTFGEDTTAPAQPLAADGQVGYEYAAVGTYTITVTAFSGGTATTSGTVEVEIVDPLLLPIDFESSTLDYEFGSFEGAAFAKANNPDTNGNNSANVGRVTKGNGAATFAGTVIELSSPIDFSTLNKLKLDVRSPLANSTVRIKLENATDNTIFAEVDAVTTQVDTWETLLYDFSGADLTREYSKIIVFFDFGNTGNNDVFFFDNVELTDQAEEKLELPINFESAVIEYSFTEFNGAPTAVVDNPFKEGINTSAKVANVNKVQGAGNFAGSFITLDEPIDFSVNQRIAMKVRSPRAGVNVLLKLENANDGSINREVIVVTTKANEWEELVFDFGTVVNSNNYQRLVFFFDSNQAGRGENYYFDDIRLTDGSVPIRLPLTFDNPDATYSFIDFGGASTSVVANPDQTGSNTTGRAARTNKSNGAEVFGASSILLSEPIDFSAFSKLKIKTWAPQSGITIKLKLENAADASNSIEVDVTNTVANQWEELTYDFAGINNANQYQRVIMFFDFGNTGIGADYYYDEVVLSN